MEITNLYTVLNCEEHTVNMVDVVVIKENGRAYKGKKLLTSTLTKKAQQVTAIEGVK